MAPGFNCLESLLIEEFHLLFGGFALLPGCPFPLIFHEGPIWMNRLTCEIESMAFGAKGIARDEGKVLFVPGGVPGDLVEASVLKDKGRFAELSIEHIRRPSHLRREAPCVHANACGGCQWLDISTAQQLDWKKDFLLSALKKFGKLSASLNIEVWPSPQSTGYRHRVRFRVVDGQLGYLAQRSHRLVAISQCAIAMPAIQQFIEHWRREEPMVPDDLQLEVQEAEAGVMVTVLDQRLSPEVRKRISGWIERMRRWPYVAWAGLMSQVSEAPCFKIESHLGVDFFTKPGQFYQANLAANRVLRCAVLEYAQSRAGGEVLDLYCGSGNLSLPLARAGFRVMGVEGNRWSIEAANHAVAMNRLEGAPDYIRRDATRGLKEIMKEGRTFDFVIADPPRSGLGDCVAPLLRLKPQAMILVGCDPNHFARDVGRFVDAGYKIERLILADFFPGTYHLESVAFMSH